MTGETINNSLESPKLPKRGKTLSVWSGLSGLVSYQTMINRQRQKKGANKYSKKLIEKTGKKKINKRMEKRRNKEKRKKQI